MSVRALRIGSLCMPVGLKAWLEMVDVEKEIKLRGRRPAFGPMSSTRNRRILAQAVEDEDKAAADAFQVRRVLRA